jgi:outer membrane protein TolC
VNRITLIIFLGLIGFCATAQDSTLSYSQFAEKVLTNHPMSRMADIEVEKAKAYLRKARGQFDPKIQYQLKNKDYKGTNYYNIEDVTLTIPTSIGPYFEVGAQQNNGTYLNPQLTTPADGLFNLGVSMPLMRGLLIDESRNALRKAKLMRTASYVEKELILNQLLLQAAESYWEWFADWNTMLVDQEGVALAQIRLDGIRTSALVGDKPYIDTLESHIQLANRKVDLQKSNTIYQASALQLSFFTWIDSTFGEMPHTPPSFYAFDQFEFPEFGLDSIKIWAYDHPELNEKTLKYQMLRVDKKLAWEQFKPQIDVQYRPLNDLQPLEDLANDWSTDNFNLGLKISVPIIFRKEMGELQSINLKREETALDIQQKKRSLYNKALAYRVKLENLKEQVELQRVNAQNYERLLEVEKIKFDIGESSVFMVNSRENKYLEAQKKLIEFIAKFQIAKSYYLYYTNQLY